MMGEKWLQEFLPQTFYQPFPSGASEATTPEIKNLREKNFFSFHLLRLPNSRDATRPSPSEGWQKDGGQKEFPIPQLGHVWALSGHATGSPFADLCVSPSLPGGTQTATPSFVRA
jgi:hypothetical protein